MNGRRKRVTHYHEPGDCHELTFSCYRRMPLLTNDLWRGMLCESIDRATQRHPFRLIAFVLMPEHVDGTAPGDADYGITEVAYDAARRRLRTTDQLGDTVTFNYDMADRLTSRDYRLRANSPSGTIADSDTFTYDDANRILTAEKDRYNNTVTLGTMTPAAWKRSP